MVENSILSKDLSSDLKGKSIRSGVINLASQGISVFLQLGSTIVLARLLTPSDFGLVAMAMTVNVFAGLFKDLGLSAATIQRETITNSQMSSMFWINVLVGFVLCGIVGVGSSSIAYFFENPDLQSIIVVLSSTILISSVGGQHSALLTRRMCFVQLSIARLTGSFAVFLITLILALTGFHYWSLVLGSVFGAVVTSILLWLFSGWVPGRPRFDKEIRDIVFYGLNLTGFEFVNYFSRTLDNILIGKYLGSTELGYYTRAYQLLMFPILQIRQPLSAVALPALSRLQSDPVRFKSYYVQLLNILALCTMPTAVFFFLEADVIIELVLGEQWNRAADIARWLAIAAFLQPVAGLFGVVLVALGLADRHFRCGLFAAIILSIIFLVTVKHGVEALAIGYAVSGYLVFLPIFLYASKGTGIRLSDFCQGIWRPTLASIAAAILLFFSEYFYSSSISIFYIFSVLLAYSVFYIGIYCVLPGGAIHLCSVLKQLCMALNLTKRFSSYMPRFFTSR